MALAHTEKAAAVAQAKRMIAPVDKKTEGLAERAQQLGAGAKVAYRENMKELAAKTEEAEGHQARPESSTSQPAARRDKGRLLQGLPGSAPGLRKGHRCGEVMFRACAEVHPWRAPARPGGPCPFAAMPARSGHAGGAAPTGVAL
jgi:hypothetical protein